MIYFHLELILSNKKTIQFFDNSFVLANRHQLSVVANVFSIYSMKCRRLCIKLDTLISSFNTSLMIKKKIKIFLWTLYL